MYCPYPWSQNSHNSSSFLRIAFFCLVNVPGDAEQKSGAMSEYCNMFDNRSCTRSSFPETTAAFVVCALPKYVFFSSPGIHFHAPKHFSSHFSFFILHRGCNEASNWGGAIQCSNPHCGIRVRPQNILRPFSSSRRRCRRRFLASDSVDRGEFALRRLGTHFGRCHSFSCLSQGMDESKISVHFQVYPICQRIHCSTHHL